LPSFNLFGIGIQAINPRGLGTEYPEINRNYPHQIAKNPIFQGKTWQKSGCMSSIM
jgi:hypothetical protein